MPPRNNDPAPSNQRQVVIREEEVPAPPGPAHHPIAEEPDDILQIDGPEFGEEDQQQAVDNGLGPSPAAQAVVNGSGPSAAAVFNGLGPSPAAQAVVNGPGPSTTAVVTGSKGPSSVAQAAVSGSTGPSTATARSHHRAHPSVSQPSRAGDGPRPSQSASHLRRAGDGPRPSHPANQPRLARDGQRPSQPADQPRRDRDGPHPSQPADQLRRDRDGIRRSQQAAQPRQDRDGPGPSQPTRRVVLTEPPHQAPTQPVVVAALSCRCTPRIVGEESLDEAGRRVIVASVLCRCSTSHRCEQRRPAPLPAVPRRRVVEQNQPAQPTVPAQPAEIWPPLRLPRRRRSAGQHSAQRSRKN